MTYIIINKDITPFATIIIIIVAGIIVSSIISFVENRIRNRDRKYKG